MRATGSQPFGAAMGVDALADPGGDGDGADDLADPLARQHVWRWPGTFLTADEQRSRASCTDMQPQQLRQVTPDRHLPALATLALTDGNHALGEADILDAKLHQLRGPGAGFQQRLQHQSGSAVLGVSLVEKAKFFLNGQPIDATAMFRGCPKARALPGSFENGFALRVVHSFPHEDGGDSGGGAFDRGHDTVCFKVFGVQAWGFRVPIRAKVDGGRRAGSAFSFPLRTSWKARLPAILHRRCAMRVRVLLQITGDDGTAGAAEEVAAFEKVTQRSEDLGLSIAEGKALLAAVQHGTVKVQAAAWSRRHRPCPVCGGKRRGKGSYPVVFRTLFGDVELDSPRLHRCQCQCQDTDGPATVSPLRDLITDHVAPERLYLEARWASLVPYAAAAGLLADILPIASGANAKPPQLVAGFDGSRRGSL
jgi:hypothetical protein